MERVNQRLVTFASLADRRRVAYCLGIALALHAFGALSHRFRAKRVVDEVPHDTAVFPVSLEGTSEPAPPPPPPPEPPPLVAPPPPEPKEPDLPLGPPKVAPPVRPAVKPPEPRRTPAPQASAPPEASPVEHGVKAFGSKRGAFRGDVCLVEKNITSALQVDGCKPVTSFRTDAINVSPRRFQRGFPGIERRVEWFGIDYRGSFKVRTSGYYTFRLVSDDGAVLFIDGAQVLENDGQHPAREMKMGVPLRQGEHEFRLLYFQGPGGSLALQLFVKGYKTPEQLFGPEL